MRSSPGLGFRTLIKECKQLLEKCGVPPRMLAVVKSFHEGMHAEARIGSDTTEKFEVRNGLRQGCTIAPLFFNIYFSGMVANWRGEWAGEGVNVLYKIGRGWLVITRSSLD